MTNSVEDAAQPSGKNVPGDELLSPVREAISELGQAQRRSEAALEAMIRSVERAVEEVARRSGAFSPTPAPPAPPQPTAPTPTQPKQTAPKQTAPVPPPPSAPQQAVAPPPEARSEAKPSQTGSEVQDPGQAGDATQLLRRRMVELQRHASEIDRLCGSDELAAHLSQIAELRGLRQMFLVEKGRNLHAQSSQGFKTLDHREGSLSRVVVPFDRDGLFGQVVSEEQVYSGPRPVHGMPVDLVLVMGKRAPAWCLLIPLRYRNRWGRFLYVDGSAEQLESLFELEVLARLAVMQLRASRARPHQPAEGLRKLRNLTLRERQQRHRRRSSASTEEQEVGPPEAKPDPLSKKDTIERPAPGLRDASRLARFDEDGHLIEPLRPNEILARIGEIPPMPHVAAQLLSKLNDPDTTVQSLQELISTDQALSARLLQIANSSLYGNMREVSAIGEAVMRLGFNSIRSWLLSTITRTVFAAAGSSGQTHRLWRQSVLCAMASQTIAENQNSCDPEVAFVAGLLQNIGLLLLVRNHPDVFLEIHESCSESLLPYYLGERQAMGFDHADLGALLLSKWGLGDELISAVASHHRLELAGESRALAATIALGEEIALRLGQGPTESSESSLADTPGAEFLQVSAEDVDSIYERVAELALDRSIFQA